MKALILYSGKHGSTAKAAGLLAQSMEIPARVADLDGGQVPGLDDFEIVILGAAVYAGSVSKSMKEYCRVHEQELIYKRLGLFLCCGFADKTEVYFAENFSPFLLSHVISRECFGGEINGKQLGFLERKMVQMALKQNPQAGDASIRTDAIERMAKNLQF